MKAKLQGRGILLQIDARNGHSRTGSIVLREKEFSMRWFTANLIEFAE